MRGAVEGLRTPFPLIETMPAVYRDDELTNRLLAILDDSVAPIVSTLDCLQAYLDPRLTPDDFLGWLSGWVGLEPRQRWSNDQLRSLMAVSIGLYRKRGTAEGVAGLVEAYTGVRPRVTDSGGAVVVARRAEGAPVTSADFPGAADPWVRIEVALPASSEVTEAEVRELVVPALPAHVRIVVEVRTEGQAP